MTPAVLSGNAGHPSYEDRLGGKVRTWGRRHLLCFVLARHHPGASLRTLELLN